MSNKLKQEELEKLCDELNNQCAQLEDKLSFYEENNCPKFRVKNNLFIVNITEKKIETLKVDEIIINLYGIHYREYLNEESFKQFPEQFCFKEENEAKKYLEKITTIN